MSIYRYGSKSIFLLLPAGAVFFLFLFFPLSCLFSVPPHLFLASPLRFDSPLCASETYTWQVRFRSSRRKRPPDCWEDIVRRCLLGVPRSRAFPSFIGVEEDSYGRQWIRSVGRVFRPSGIKTESLRRWAQSNCTVYLGERKLRRSDVLQGFIGKRRSFIDDYYPSRAGRSGIQFREPGHRCRIICHRLALALLPLLYITIDTTVRWN